MVLQVRKSVETTQGYFHLPGYLLQVQEVSPLVICCRCRRSQAASSSYREASPKVGNVVSPTTPFPTLCLTEAAPPSGTTLPLSPSSLSLLL